MTNDNGIYVTGCVIPNGLPDHENDILSKKEIKIIFTKYLEHDTDTMHSYIRNQGVDLVANWISEIDTNIAGKIAPAGSWLATFYVTNPDIIKSIYDSNPDSINGLSLGSVPKTITDTEYWFINKSINYRDVEDTEDIIPMFISFVDKPSNGFGLEIEDYNVYINKSVNSEVESMSNQNETPQEEKLSLSGWEKVIKSFQSLGINKAETGATNPEEEKVETKEEDEKDISNAELLEKIPEAVSSAIVSAFEKIEEEKAEKETEPVEKAESEEEEKEEEDEVKEPAKETKENAVNKRATEKVENTSNPNTTTGFYEKSGRDMFGCRIK